MRINESLGGFGKTESSGESEEAGNRKPKKQQAHLSERKKSVLPCCASCKGVGRAPQVWVSPLPWIPGPSQSLDG